MADKPKPRRRLAAGRVSQDAWDVLEIVRVARGVKSMQDTVGPILEEYASRRAEEPEIKDALKAIRAVRVTEETPPSRPRRRNRPPKG